jgi:hypothetical protein
MSHIEVNTTQYQFAHGSKPRGYGNWAFFFDKESEPQWYIGKFSDAKKSAIAYAVAKGHSQIAVGS